MTCEHNRIVSGCSTKIKLAPNFNVNSSYIKGFVVPPSDLSDKDLYAIARIVKSYSGLKLDTSKKALVISRLSKRLRALDMKDFKTYVSYLTSPDGQKESFHMTIALTTNTTAFFREAHHFQALQNLFLRRVSDQTSQGRSLRIWSASTSSGEEAYSAAFSVFDVIKSDPRYDVRILATDINPYVLQTARKGVYKNDNKTNIPKKNYYDFCVEDKKDNSFSISQNIKSLIFFQEMNLMDAWPVKKKMDAIFCRNTFIYFEEETKKNILRRMTNILHIGGELYLGHSEHIRAPEEYGLKSFGTTSYRKVSA